MKFWWFPRHPESSENHFFHISDPNSLAEAKPNNLIVLGGLIAVAAVFPRGHLMADEACLPLYWRKSPWIIYYHAPWISPWIVYSLGCQIVKMVWMFHECSTGR